VTLNCLGLVALDSFRRRRLRGFPAFLLLAAVPLSILATKTRTVWIAFTASIVLLAVFSPSLRLRGACRALLLVGGLCTLAALSFLDVRTSLADRLREREPLEFRRDMYQAGWAMFLEKPFIGWSSNSIQSELSKRVPDFQPERFIFHSTYIEIAVEDGAVGVALYAWLMIDLLRLGKRNEGNATGNAHFLDGQFHVIWQLLLIVYLVNASFVVMSYQFVNGLLFTIAGILATQKRVLASANRMISLKEI
jgi:O-antigen ligase